MTGSRGRPGGLKPLFLGSYRHSPRKSSLTGSRGTGVRVENRERRTRESHLDSLRSLET